MAKYYYNSQEWKELRQRAFDRDGHKCQVCSKGTGKTWLNKYFHKKPVSLVAHHIKPRSEGGKDDLDNLQTLCRSCHSSLPLSDNHKEQIRRAITGSKKRGS